MFRILLRWQTQQVNMGDLYYYTWIELIRTPGCVCDDFESFVIHTLPRPHNTAISNLALKI